MLPSSTKAETFSDKVPRNSIFAVSRPVRWFARVFGLVPFAIRFNAKTNKALCKVRLFDGIWLVTSLFIYVGSMWFNLYYDFHREQTNSYVLILGGRITVVGGCFLCGFCVFLDMVNRHRILEVFQKVFDFDQSAKTMNFAICVAIQKRFIRIAFVLNGCLAWALVVYTAIALHKITTFNVWHVTFFVIFTVMSMAVTKIFLIYIYLMLVIRWRYLLLNKHLR